MLILFGIGSNVLMLAGLGVAIWQLFVKHDVDTAMIGLAFCSIGADFAILYLIRMGYLEWGILSHILFGCFSLITVVVAIRLLINRKS